MPYDVKAGVDLTGLSREIQSALAAADEAWRSIGRTLTVTSGVDSHTTGLHPVGRALDLRTRDLAPGEAAAMVAELRRRLGRDYDVILESDHIHMEFDPKGGAWSPAPVAASPVPAAASSSDPFIFGALFGGAVALFSILSSD